MGLRPRITQVDPAFLEAVALALRRYRDGYNPEQSTLSDTELAKRLGVSKSTVSKYLSCKQIIGGEPLRRMLTELRIAIAYKGTEILAFYNPADQSRRISEQSPQQISFVFGGPCRLNETPENVTVSIDRKEPQSSSVTVQIKIAG
jgi:transcriptional regulator with XRE-family HTH domain